MGEHHLEPFSTHVPTSFCTAPSPIILNTPGFQYETPLDLSLEQTPPDPWCPPLSRKPRRNPTSPMFTTYTLRTHYGIRPTQPSCISRSTNRSLRRHSSPEDSTPTNITSIHILSEPITPSYSSHSGEIRNYDKCVSPRCISYILD